MDKSPLVFVGNKVQTDFSFLYSLYEVAFPIYERRTWEQLVSMLVLPNMQVMVAKLENIPIGFAIYWKIDGWVFLEHLAVHPQQEGKGHGSKMIKWMLQQSENRLLLEAELPTDEASHRRIRFYEKQGLQIAPFFYQQPPYRLGAKAPAMHILSTPHLVNAAEFTSITTAIRQQVFESFY